MPGELAKVSHLTFPELVTEDRGNVVRWLSMECAVLQRYFEGELKRDMLERIHANIA